MESQSHDPKANFLRASLVFAVAAATVGAAPVHHSMVEYAPLIGKWTCIEVIDGKARGTFTATYSWLYAPRPLCRV